MLVNIESPFAGDVTTNIDYARNCMRHSLLLGEYPIASHLLYTQPGILNDDIEKERNLGIAAGLAWNIHADMTVVYMDLGISDGMKKGIINAYYNGRPVAIRSLCKAGQTQIDQAIEILKECKHIAKHHIKMTS